MVTPYYLVVLNLNLKWLFTIKTNIHKSEARIGLERDVREKNIVMNLMPKMEKLGNEFAL